MTLRNSQAADRISVANSLQDALLQLQDGLSPDIILLDLNLPDVDGLDGLVRLKMAAPDTPVVVVSSLSENAMITMVMREGAAGFIPKDSPKDKIMQAFAAIWHGGSTQN